MKDTLNKMPREVAVYQFDDGRELVVNSDNSQIIRYPNGNKEITLSNGRIMYYVSDLRISVICSGPRFLHRFQVEAKVAKKKVQTALRGY